jgi:hypothetical protein
MLRASNRRVSIVRSNGPEAAIENGINTACLAQRPSDPVLKLRFTERVFEGRLEILNGSDVRADFLSFLQSSGLGQESRRSILGSIVQPFRRVTMCLGPARPFRDLA